MKLKLKFSLTIVIFIVLSSAVITYSIRSFRHALELKEYQVTLNSTITDWFKLRVTITDFFTIGFDTANVAQQWEKIRSQFKSDFDTITTSGLLEEFGPDVQETMVKSVNVYKLINESLEQLTEQLVEVTTTELTTSTKAFLKSSGLAETYNSVDTDSRDAGTIILLYSRLSTLLDRTNIYTDPYQSLLETLRKQIDAEVNGKIMAISVISIIGFIIMDIFIFLIITGVTGKITKRLLVIGEATGRIAARDLTVKVSDNTSDEIGELANDLVKTMESLNGFMNGVKLTATEATGMSESIDYAAADVTAAGTQISSNIGSLRQQFEYLRTAVSNALATLETMTSFIVTVVSGITEQNASIDESSVSITNMNESISRISEKGREKAETIIGLKASLTEGEQTVEATETLLTGITAQLGEVNSFIEIINSISEQTSILSMNAAIESAHAGESGKGFAVVADEIQKLADSTTENALLITKTLTEIIQNVDLAKKSSHVATKTFESTVREIGELITTLNDIVSEIGSVDDQSTLLAANYRSLSSSTEELSTKTKRLDDLRNKVGNEMGQMNDIFYASLSGIDEIQTGSEDILHKILTIHELSGSSKDKMGALHATLNDFKTVTD